MLRRGKDAQIAEAIHRGQQAFHERLTRDAIQSAERLAESYRRLLRDANADLAAIKRQGGTPSNAALDRYTQRLQVALSEMEAITRQEANKMQPRAVEAGAQAGAAALRGAGVAFASPAPEQIQAAVRYIDSAAFQQTLNDFAGQHVQRASDIMLGGLAAGKGADYIVRQLRQYSQMPLTDAQRTVRTLQLWSARRGAQEIYRANADVVREWIWWAARVNSCLGCLAMHGKRFPVTEVLNGHHLCRCAMVPVTADWGSLGFNTGTDLPVDVESGEAWFRSLPTGQQEEIMGGAMWRAWRDGAFEFDQLVSTYDNSVYGTMRRDASLREILGAEAAKYYGKAG